MSSVRDTLMINQNTDEEALGIKTNVGEIGKAMNDSVSAAKNEILEKVGGEDGNKYVAEELNSTIKTNAFQSLDMLTSAKILLKGVKGETFHFVNETLNMDFEIAMDANTPVGNSGYREMLVPVALGEWKIAITIPDTGTDSKTVQVSTMGVTYVLNYEIQNATPLVETTSSGSYTIPDEIEGVVVIACGAGGSGGSGYNQPGGGGGGGAAIKCAVLVTENKTIDFTIGIGGNNDAHSGVAGGATILSGAISCTLGGGGGGAVAAKYESGRGGYSGGTGGGAGGSGEDGADGLIGKGGTANSSSGGGGSIGTGGAGGLSTANRTGFDGEKGSGGGGGVGGTSSDASIGGKGGDGYVAIYKGVIIE